MHFLQHGAIAQYLPQLLLAWSIQLIGIVSPGPGVMLILGVATAQGRKPALATAFGISCGSVVLAVFTVVGLTAVLAQIAEMMTVIRLFGAAYLLWLAWKAFRNATNRQKFEIAAAPARSARRSWLTGLTLQLSNPKAIFFWLAIASLGGMGHAPLPVIAIFVVGAFANSFAAHAGYALLLSSPIVRAVYLRFRRWVEGALGCFFVFASFELATAK